MSETVMQAPVDAALEPPSLGELDAAHLWHPYTDMSAYADRPLVLVRGDGCYVEDDAGNRYVDAIAGLWNVQVGHGRREIVAAAAAQLETLPFTPLNGRGHEPGIRLAEKLVALAPGALRHVFYTTSGAESVEVAIKVARQYWRNRGRAGRYKIVDIERAFHGCTLGALSAGGLFEDKQSFEPLAEGFLRIPLPHSLRCPHGQTHSDCATQCAEALDRLIVQEGSETIAAFLGEPVLGAAGMVVPAPEFWTRIQEICRRHDILLMVDEVAMGFGRTGRMFASEHYGLEPDVLATAKGITSGYVPLGAVLATDAVFDEFLGTGREFGHGSTFAGHPVACAAAVANLELIVNERLCERAAELGVELLERLRVRLDGCPVVGEVRGLGLAIGIDLVNSSGAPLSRAGELCDRLRERGILVRPVGWSSVLPMMPPLMIPRATAFAVADAYAEAVWELAHELVAEGVELDGR
jgi:adenosylmethionine-8-amino-7-oxononanoate aminotransferase